MEEAPDPTRSSPLGAAWAIPLLAGAGALVAIAVVRARRRGRLPRVGAWRRTLRTPFRVDTVPDELRRIGAAPGLVVLEVSCGAGGYLEETARTVGRGGEARGLESDPDLAEVARRRLGAQGLGGVAIDVGPTDHLPYADGDFDLAYLVAGLSRLRDRESTLLELHRVLKPGGRLAITEHLAEASYVPASLVRRSCEAAGFLVADHHDGRWDYTSAFRKPGAA